MSCSPNDSQCGESEKPAHKVKITKSFYMGKYGVTQGQWEAVMGSFFFSNNPSYFKDCGKDYPLEQVRWKDVME